MGADAEFNLLLSNYTLSDLLTDTVAGRDVWMMELRPKKDGKPHQQLWIDKKSGVVLENKRYRPQDQYAVVSRFVRFSTNQPGSAPQKKREKEDDLADQKRKAVEHGLDPDFLSQDDWEQATGRKFLFPDSLPHGFSFESIDFFPIGNDMVSHVRYIDGLVVLSVFETSRPVRIPKITRAGNQEKDFQTTHIAPFSLPESVFQRRVDDRYFIFMSDTSEEFLKAVADSLK
jgi:negative regulator of sigma E activity